MKPLRQLASALVLTLMSLVFVTVVLELLVVGWLARPLIPDAADDFLALVHSPSDEYGDGPRLVGLGDSFGAAGGPSTNVFRLTARRVFESSGQTPRVRNLSIGGLAPADSAALLAAKGSPVSPGDAVVQLIFGGNDFNDAMGDMWVAGSYPLRRMPTRLHFDGWLWPRIVIFGVVHSLAAKTSGLPETVVANWTGPMVGSPMFGALIKDSVVRDRSLPGVYSPSFAEMLWREGRAAWTGPSWPEGHPQLARALRAVRAWTAERGLVWLVVYVPDRAALDPAVAARIGPPPAGSDPDRPRRWLKAASAAVGADAFVDLTAAFAGALDGREPLWLPDDTHWSTHGRLIAAEQIAAHLLQHPQFAAQ